MMMMMIHYKFDWYNNYLKCKNNCY